MILLEPITSQECEISTGRREWYGNDRTACDFEATKASCSLVHAKGRKIEVATNLVFHLEHVSEVLPRWDGAVGTIDSILP